MRNILENIIGICGFLLMLSFIYCYEIKHWIDAKSRKYWEIFWIIVCILLVVCIILRSYI